MAGQPADGWVNHTKELVALAPIRRSQGLPSVKAKTTNGWPSPNFMDGEFLLSDLEVSENEISMTARGRPSLIRLAGGLPSKVVARLAVDLTISKRTYYPMRRPLSLSACCTPDAWNPKMLSLCQSQSDCCDLRFSTRNPIPDSTMTRCKLANAALRVSAGQFCCILCGNVGFAVQDTSTGELDLTRKCNDASDWLCISLFYFSLALVHAMELQA